MSIFAQKDLQSYALDRRYFVAFLTFQGLMVVGSILYTPLLPALLTLRARPQEDLLTFW